MICLSEWKTFFAWCTERGEGEKYLAKVEGATNAVQERFNARVEAVFKKLDSDKSGELSMEEMERTFGEETHDFWSNMDGERNVTRVVYSSINTTSYISSCSRTHAPNIRPCGGGSS